MVRWRWILISLATLLCVAMGWQISLAKAPAAAATGVKWQPTLDEAKRVATQTNRLILVHFWAPSCKECMQLEKEVYSQPRVQQAIEAKFVPLKLNTDDFPTTTKQYGVDRLPTDLVITPAGQIVGRMKCPLTPDAYIQQLSIAASGAGPAGQLGAAPASPAGMGMSPAAAPAAQVALAAPVNASPAQPPLAPPAATVAPPVTAMNAPVMSNPSWAIQPPPAVAAQPAQPAVQPAQAVANPAQPPKNSAYSDDRYAEYFARFPSNTAAVPAASPVAVSSPAAAPQMSAAPQLQVSAAPTQASQPLSQYTPTPGIPQYNSPAANPVQYTSPAAGQGAASGVAAAQMPAMGVSWPATPAPALTAAAATQPYTGAPPIAAPAGTLTGVAAAPPAAAPVTAVTPSLTTAPPVGLDGYCPVTLAEQKRWQVGDRKYGVIHRGRTYLFAGPVEQQKFLSNPDHYSPAISGQDVVAALDQGQTVDGRRQFGLQYQGRTYLFASDASRKAFSQNPKRYAAEVLQAENPNRPPLR